MIKACLFDLDGTLLDTLESIKHFVNATVTPMGLLPIDREETKKFVGKGAKDLIKKVLLKSGIDAEKPENEKLYLQILDKYIADYNAAPLVLRQTLVNLVNTDLRNELHKITASTLLIWGENDTATPLSDAKIIESLIKDAGLCVINGAGHFAFAEAPKQTAAILNSFLG